MTHHVGGRRRRIPRGWLLPLSGLVLLLIATSGGLASRAILLDIVAWWPVWALVVTAAFLARDARWGKVRVSGLVPLLAVATLAVFGWGYAAGWALMPSAGVELIGPKTDGIEVAAISARLDGSLDVIGSSSEFAYQVVPHRAGGEIGGPEAEEQIQGSSFAATLRPIEDPGFYTYSGWSLSITKSVSWNLTIGGDPARVNLLDVSVSELHLIGRGEASLGRPSGLSPVTVEGVYTILVPVDAPVRLIGKATVPAEWAETPDGWESPVPGDGWLISVAPEATLVVEVG